MLELVFELTPTPPANEFVRESKIGETQHCFPLDVYQCLHCGHVQLLTAIQPETLFREYVYVSGTSPVFVNHFRSYAESIIQDYGILEDSLIVEIGSNDGTLLSFFKEKGMRVLGIDPATIIAERTASIGIETIAHFFDEQLGREIHQERGPASVIPANNVFAHVDDLIGFVSGIRELLADDGIFVFEVSYLLDVYEKTLFDMTYHEHLSYHSVTPLKSFFQSQGLQLIHVERVDTHGGSLRGIVQKAGGFRETNDSIRKLVDLELKLGLNKPGTWVKFKERVDKKGQELMELLKLLKKKKKNISGYGAPAKSTTLMYQYGIDSDTIDYIVDDSPWKQTLFSPGLHIPLVSSSMLKRRPPDYLLILAWNFAESIMDNLKGFAEAGGKFIVPLPDLHVI
jgi:SAM-dependent methyltransferase|tara:strand:- start:900 stop:2093 length:1194 start_codon:yes stop_codon:yes gene_type:complete